MKKAFTIIFLVSLTSCTSMLLTTALERRGFFDEKADLKLIRNGEKTVLFLEMRHIGRQEFYKDVAHKVDSLQNSGFVVFYELVKGNTLQDSLEKALYYKKTRKITGLRNTKYYDTTTSKIVGKYKYRGNYKLVSQPKYDELNVNMKTAINADMKINTLIDEFEARYGEIKLDECDWSTPLDAKKYKCKLIDEKLRDKFRKEFMINRRNRNLANEISAAKNNNILVIYGKNHFDGLLLELKKLDPYWNYS